MSVAKRVTDSPAKPSAETAGRITKRRTDTADPQQTAFGLPHDPARKLEAQQYFGKKVRELREAAGISRVELALSIGLAETNMALIERGDRDVRLSTVWRYAVGLGVSMRDLVPPEKLKPEPRKQLFPWKGKSRKPTG